MVGNNDLTFPSEFIDLMCDNLDYFEKYAVVSPDLITLDGVHQNPHVMRGISRFRQLVWDIYFSNYILAIVIGRIARLTKRFTERKDYQYHEVAGPIEQGYGACYILGPCFFRNFERLWAPTFLMGEEAFLAAQLKQKELGFYYAPVFKVYHHDHATVSKLPSKQLWGMTRDSHEAYRRLVRSLERPT